MRKTKKVHRVKRRRYKSKGGVKSTTFKIPRPYHLTTGTPSALRLREKFMSKKTSKKKDGNLSAQEVLTLNIPRVQERMLKQERRKTQKRLAKMKVNRQLDTEERRKRLISKNNQTVNQIKLGPGNAFTSWFVKNKTK